MGTEESLVLTAAWTAVPTGSVEQTGARLAFLLLVQ